jgi:hypothetical protein
MLKCCHRVTRGARAESKQREPVQRPPNLNRKGGHVADASVLKNKERIKTVTLAAAILHATPDGKGDVKFTIDEAVEAASKIYARVVKNS